ncbi:MAG: GspH/FimT family pseudopilin [Lautropia sp.]|nr:GspH/FimT family pseudopilin [Lautropia sp.]
MRHRRNIRGFTLVEMIVVMAVFGVIAAIAAPSFRDFVLRRAVSAQISDLSAALRLARSEAIKRGGPVTLCPTSNAHTPSPTCDAGSQWGNGYMVLIDNGTAASQYLRVQQRYGNQSHITAAAAGRIVFMGNGILNPASPRQFAFGPGDTGADASRSELVRTVCISSTGTVSNGVCR